METKNTNTKPYINLSTVYSSPCAGSGLLGCDIEKQEADRLAREEAEKTRRQEADFWEQLEKIAQHSI